MKKNIKVMGYGLWMMVVLFVSTPLTAQNAQEWQSTSTMQGSGSAYRSQVTAVGATGVAVLGAGSSRIFSNLLAQSAFIFSGCQMIITL